MSDEFAATVINQDKDPRYNAEGGLTVTPGSASQREMARWEQFPGDKWACGNPGNPYVYRPFPKMLYRAERFEGKVACGAPAPDRLAFRGDNVGDRSFAMAEEAARRFTERCQMIVKDQSEYARAMESGWRESPDEAMAFLERREDSKSESMAHRNYEDRNMSPAARAEIAAAELAQGEPLAEIVESRRARKPRGNEAPAA